MEVHHHPTEIGSHTARKKWTHYFWEFLMLFLAVFCGFLAEFQLEHKIEKSREKQYIKSFVEDLEADTVSLNSNINYCLLTIKKVDSAIAALNSPDRNEKAGEIYYFLRWMHRSDMFTINDRTIVQLRNAGGMRLVTNKAVSDSMTHYYEEVENIRFVYEEQTEFRRSLRPHFPRLLNGNDWGKVIDDENTVIRTSENIKLRSEDDELINTFVLILNNIKGINMGIKRRIERLKVRANIIREFIIKEYHLK
jgi:hypothetical protein